MGPCGSTQTAAKVDPEATVAMAPKDHPGRTPACIMRMVVMEVQVGWVAKAEPGEILLRFGFQSEEIHH
jgi:pyrimidine deaminase RibD-like protein